MKRIIIALLLLLALSLSVFAADDLIRDHAGLLTKDEMEALEEEAQRISDAYDTQIVILTLDTLDGEDPENYAGDYFDTYGLGAGENNSGVLFLVSIDSREYYILTNGDAHSKLSYFDLGDIEDAFLSDLSDGNYYDAFSIFLECIEEELSYEPTETGWGTKLLIALVIGAAAGGITLLVMRRKMNTIRPQHGAASYMTDGSYDLFRCHDFFLYSHVSKIRREENSSSGGGGGSRGGRGGRF